MARITAGTTLLRKVTTDPLIGLGTGGLTLVATLVMTGVVDPVLLGVTPAVIVGAGTVPGLIVPRINRASRQAQDAVGVMGAALERILGALRTVKASGAEPREERALHEAAEESRRQSVRAAKWSAAAGNTAGLAMQIVERLPNGLETLVGHHGTKLSGGERRGCPPGRSGTGGGWPSPVRCCAGRACCCSTRPPRSWTRSTRRRCATP